MIAALAWACSTDKDAADAGALPFDVDQVDADTDTDTDLDTETDADTGSGTTPSTPTWPEPGCEDAAPISEATFVDTFVDKYCWWWAACGNADPCPAAPAEDCRFDAGAGCACLDGPWSCSGNAVVPAPACAQACGDNSSGSGGWTPYGSGAWGTYGSSGTWGTYGSSGTWGTYGSSGTWGTSGSGSTTVYDDWGGGSGIPDSG